MTTQVVGVVCVCPFDDPDALDEHPPPIISLAPAAARGWPPPPHAASASAIARTTISERKRLTASHVAESRRPAQRPRQGQPHEAIARPTRSSHSSKRSEYADIKTSSPRQIQDFAVHDRHRKRVGIVRAMPTSA
jgi:hypothetical protein